jgi:DNA-binding PadR family transcriptional regulator
MVPLYILGLLQRFGPQHGYQIKKIIADQLSDFTQIKLPTIYYHLEKMEADGLLSASSEKPGARPEKTVYAVTEKGLAAFQEKLAGLLALDYRPVFPADGVFYFSDYIEPRELSGSLRAHIDRLRAAIAHIEAHKKETMPFVPEEDRIMVDIIFGHHARHYQAELDWAEESLGRLMRSEETL